jgi:hypothetical protein
MRSINILTIIYLIISIFGCKSAIDQNAFYVLKENDEVYIDIHFTKDIKVNNKTILYDLTGDVQKHLSLKEVTDDLLNSGKYLYKKEQLDQIKYYESIFTESMLKNLKQRFSKNNLMLKVSPYSTELPDEAKVISVIINSYQEGEFNLIKNIPTKIEATAKIFKKDYSRNVFVLFIKQFTCKADINNSIEKLRINGLTDMIASDIVKYAIKNYLSEKDIINYSDINYQSNSDVTQDVK